MDDGVIDPSAPSRPAAATVLPRRTPPETCLVLRGRAIRRQCADRKNEWRTRPLRCAANDIMVALDL